MAGTITTVCLILLFTLNELAATPNRRNVIPFEDCGESNCKCD